MRRLFLFLCLVAVSLVAGPVRADSPEEQIAAASALFSAGKYVECAQRLDAFLAATPRHEKAGVVAFTLGRCRSELKQFPQAVAAYEKAVASKDAAVLKLAYLGLGEAATYTHEYDKAAAALEVAVKGALAPDQAAPAWYWLGQADYQLQKFGLALAAYDTVTREYSKSDFADSALYGAGICALKLMKTEEARQDFRALLSRYPKSSDRPQAAFLLAQIDLDAKRYAEARTAFESLLTGPGSDAAATRLRAAAEDGLIQCLLALQDYKSAAGRLEAAIARLPATDAHRFAAQLSLGHSRYHLKDYEPAYAVYLEASKAAEPAVASEALYWAGNAALAQKKFSDAAAHFSSYVRKYAAQPLAAKAQLRAGDAFANAQQNDAATQAYKAVIANYGQSPEAADAKQALQEMKGEQIRGSILAARREIQAGRYAEAQTSLNSLLRSNPDPDIAAEAQYLLGVTYENLKQPTPAAAAYAESMRLKPTAPWMGELQSSLAWLWLDLKQPANAEKAAAAALALNLPKEQDEQARLALIQALLEQGKWEAVMEGCKVILDKHPARDTVPTVLYVQATALDRQKKADEALVVWEKLAGDYPKSEYAAQGLMRSGEARSKAEKWADAQAKFSQLIAAFPQSPFVAEARFNLGAALFRQDKFAEAATAYSAVADDKAAGELMPEALFWAGVAYTKSDKKDEAIKRLADLVEKYPNGARTQSAKTRLAALRALKGL